MKNRFFHACLLLALAFPLLAISCKEQELPGSIYGTVTDKATGEPINAAGVELYPTGSKTVTGSEGQFEFAELESGDYRLAISKTGYIELTDIKVAVKAGIQTKSDIQIEKLPPALRVVDGDGNDITELDFGIAEADVARSFNIFNDGTNTLQWEITTTADWIKSVSKSSGELSAGATQSLILTIDREKLKGGENTTTMHITSNDGSKQVTVKAQSTEKSLPGMNMLQVTDIKMNTAVFHAEITNTGAPSYTERGFVYATSSMPTLDNTLAKLTAPVNEESTYTATATNLQTDQTYYVRAYAINDLGVNYSTNETSFTTQMVLPEVTTGPVSDKSIAHGRASVEGTIVDAGEPAYTERGFAYGVNHNPTVEDDTKKVVSGSGTGVFSANLTNLAEGNVYYIRAYATNAKGTAYGSEAVLDFHAVLPEVRTDAVSDISPTSATLNGTILSVGDPRHDACPDPGRAGNRAGSRIRHQHRRLYPQPQRADRAGNLLRPGLRPKRGKHGLWGYCPLRGKQSRLRHPARCWNHGAIGGFRQCHLGRCQPHVRKFHHSRTHRLATTHLGRADGDLQQQRQYT